MLKLESGKDVNGVDVNIEVNILFEKADNTDCYMLIYYPISSVDCVSHVILEG